MAHLEKVGRDVCIKYLEHIVQELGELGADFHEKLIELYLAEVAQGSKIGGTSCSFFPSRPVSREQ